MTDQTGTARFAVTPASGGQPPVVAVFGDVDLANVAEFEETMAGALGDSPALTVDLTGVDYSDSAAMRALFGMAATTKLTLWVRPAF